jgi:hypothetical protein
VCDNEEASCATTPPTIMRDRDTELQATSSVLKPSTVYSVRACHAQPKPHPPGMSQALRNGEDVCVMLQLLLQYFQHMWKHRPWA